MLSIPFILGIGTIGFSIGYLIARSRKSAVGTAVKCIISFLGGSIVTLIAGIAPNLFDLVGYSLISFSAGIFIGTIVGFYFRGEG